MEIIAALIIACSNLTQPGHNRESSREVKEYKIACIKRVKDCTLKAMTKINSNYESLKCADQVY